MAQGLIEYKMKGIHLHKKVISAGTMTRIVTNTMGQNKASQNLFLSQLFLLLLVFISFALFSNCMYIAAFIVWVLSSNLIYVDDIPF